MPLGSSTALAVDRAVDLVNLHVESGGQISQDDLPPLLGSYAADDAPLDAAAFNRLGADLHEALHDPSPAERIRRINHLLERLQPIPRLRLHDEGHGDPGAYFEYGVIGSEVDRIAAVMVMAIANAVVEEGEDRFGWCAAPQCARLFFDRSRNRSQRFCSRVCATRVHVRAHRARQ